MSGHITWSEQARADLDALVDHIAKDNPTMAWQIFDRIVERVGSLTHLTGRGRLVPEITISQDPPLHELIEGPWRIMYAVDEDQVVIAAIVDSRRDIEAFLKERFPGHWPTDN